MTTPCSSAVAPATEKTALLVASGRNIDELLTNVLASEGWSIERVGGYYGCIRESAEWSLEGKRCLWK